MRLRSRSMSCSCLVCLFYWIECFTQQTAYEMRISDWSSDVCSSDLVDVANVGGWRSGLLVYNGTPLSVVAEDLKRTAGMRVSIAPDATDLSFRGAPIIAKNRDRTIADLAALSGTKAERQGDGWILTR